MPTMIDLRPNRRLVETNFEGYKLNLQALPIYSYELKCPVDKAYADDIQYSFAHAKLFALHNHIVLDYWDHSFNYYYIDNKQQVHHVLFENTTRKFEDIVVYDIPAHEQRIPGHFNLCLNFASENLAMISDGTGYLHIVDTCSRYRKNDNDKMWRTLYSNLVLGKGKYFVLLDCRLHEEDNIETLHCLLQSIVQGEKHSDSVITWVQFENNGEEWKQTNMKQLKGKGILHYAAIESGCQALYVATDHPFKFVLDTEKEVVEPEQKKSKKIIYTWLQTTEDITITLKLKENFDRELLQVSVTSSTIKVNYAEDVFLDGSFNNKIDSNLTTWNVQPDGRVDILLTKAESVLWPDFLDKHDDSGEQILDPALVEEAHKRLAHLCSETEVISENVDAGVGMQELEECDVASEEDTMLVRFEAANHQITHRTSLSVNQYLFSVRLETREVPALALRYDVDACIWQPYRKLVNSDIWPIKHQFTLPAFGYVQSSKQNRKFVTCPPNSSYSVVSEMSRHIFIYKSTTDQNCQLRRRSEGISTKVKIGHQFVVNVEKYGEVLGISATNDYLFVLLEKHLLAIEMV